MRARGCRTTATSERRTSAMHRMRAADPVGSLVVAQHQRSATATRDSTASSRNSAWTPSGVHDRPTDGRPDGEAERARGAHQADGEAQAVARRALGQLGQHHPGVAQDEADQRHEQEQLRDVGHERQQQEQHRLDDRAPDDDHLAAVAVRPGAPERARAAARRGAPRRQQPHRPAHVGGRHARGRAPASGRNARYGRRPRSPRTW